MRLNFTLHGAVRLMPALQGELAVRCLTVEELAEKIPSQRVTITSVIKTAALGWSSRKLFSETLGVNKATPTRWIQRGSYLGNIERNENGKYRLILPGTKKVEGIQVEKPADTLKEVPIEELLAQRRIAFERKKAKMSSERTVWLQDDLPYGIVILGDPHVDNDGCNIDLLMRHISAVTSTEGAWLTCIGDVNDNWIGRLGRLYANASILASDGWRISEWLLSQGQWLAVVGGNHDAWAHSPGLDPLSWLTKKHAVKCYDPDELRLSIRVRDRDDLRPVHLWMRHDFPGRSWFHASHAPNKAAMLDGRVDVAVCGHTHSFASLRTEQPNGRVTHAIRVRGYKFVDGYAKQKGFKQQEHGASCMIIVDPVQLSQEKRIQEFWDIERGCEYLTMLRAGRRKGTM